MMMMMMMINPEVHEENAANLKTLSRNSSQRTSKRRRKLERLGLLCFEITPSTSVYRRQRFGGRSCLHLQESHPKLCYFCTNLQGVISHNIEIFGSKPLN